MLGLHIPLSALGKGQECPLVIIHWGWQCEEKGITLCHTCPDPLAIQERSQTRPASGQSCSEQDLGSQHPLVGEGRGGRGMETRKGEWDFRAQSREQITLA